MQYITIQYKFITQVKQRDAMKAEREAEDNDRKVRRRRRWRRRRRRRKSKKRMVQGCSRSDKC